MGGAVAENPHHAQADQQRQTDDRLNDIRIQRHAFTPLLHVRAIPLYSSSGLAQFRSPSFALAAAGAGSSARAPDLANPS